MRFANRLNNAETELEFKLYEPIFTLLARTYVSQVDAHKRYRSKDEPGLTVQTVSVQDGGHAIVGHLRMRPGMPDRPKTLPHLSQLPMPS